ncbi:MAG: hypothetical protein KatS3mg111_4012 [Pirellulaceae bacterium]|nr:MAG: hypothetical protein KatS3mg111_4012 [Pirellulaceae bacterium]
MNRRFATPDADRGHGYRTGNGEHSQRPARPSYHRPVRRGRRRPWGWVGLVVCLYGLPAIAAGGLVEGMASTVAEEAVDASEGATTARMAVVQESPLDAPSVERQHLPRTPWFDPRSGTFLPPELEPVYDDPLRSSDWVKVPAKDQSAPISKTPARGGGPITRGLSSDTVSALVLIILGVLLLIILMLLVYYSLRYQSADPAKSIVVRSLAIDPSRVEALPFEAAEEEFFDPLTEAERLAKQGAFNEAVVRVYGYLLLALDRAGCIELERGKTNRMYVRELQSWNRLREVVETAMLVFEDAFFGEHAISAARFQSVWLLLDEFHQLVPQHASGADGKGTAPQEVSAV